MEKISIKDPSPLVLAVLALDGHLAEMNRLGSKITEMKLKTDFDFEQAGRLVNVFSESAQNMAAELVNLSNCLNEARSQAEAVSAAVADRAKLLSSRKTEEDQKIEEFRKLGEDVRTLTQAVAQWKPPEGRALSPEERVALSARLAEFETQLNPLIEKSQLLREGAQASKMKALAQNTESLAQTLKAVRSKLSSLH